MLKKLIDFLRIFFTDPRWVKVRAVFWFVVITLAIHVCWRFWVIYLDTWPLYNFMLGASDVAVGLVYEQSTWFVRHILGIPISENQNAFYCANGYGLILNDSCSGIKQIMQFVILMLVFPGPWKHKLWFIPFGVVVVHLTNVLRIILLTIITEHWPSYVETAHDEYLRIMFYVVIFGLWLLWVEKVSSPKTEKK